MTHVPEELAANINNRDFISDADKKARIAANFVEITKIQTNIDAGFFQAVY